MGQKDEKDPDAFMAAQTARLVAEMEATIARAKIILGDSGPVASLEEEKEKVVLVIPPKS